MTYKEFIARVNDKVRVADDWPKVANVIAIQVDLSWLAALAVSTEIPLSSFGGEMFKLEPLSSDKELGGIDLYGMPSDLFRYRQDLGISSIEINETSYQLDESVALSSLRSLSKNPFYKEEPFFHVNVSDRRFYAISGCSVHLNYLKEFSKPAVDEINGDPSPVYPLDGTHAERAASIVATHVQGETSRDMAAAQFQALLQRQYTSAPAPAVQATESEQ